VEREAKFQDKLKDLIEAVAGKFRFHGLEITRVERDYPIDARKADLVLFMRGEMPFMFIETKRIGRESGPLDPLDVAVVGQVVSYAAIYKRDHKTVVPFVATANPSRIAVFRTPENVEDYVNKDAVLKRDYQHAFKPRMYLRLLKDQLVRCENLGLNEEYIRALLERLAKSYVEKRVPKVEFSEALIGTFREFVNRIAEECRPLVEVEVKGALKTEVERRGYKVDSASLPSTVALISRMMAYVLMNKILFYKIIEQSYRDLQKMVSLDSSSSIKFREQLKHHFRRAVEVTGDFEPIFSTGVYDRLPIPDNPEVMEYINDFIATLDNVEIIELADRIGYVYEELIPPEERHQLGQFYTPSWVCELITRWCIRSPEDAVLDPGVGSGGFFLQAYRRLFEKKVGPGRFLAARPDIHEKILSQLYALDINEFPAHLSAMAVSMQSITVPSTKLNVLVSDFFAVQPGQMLLTPYRVKSIAKGEEEREVTLPKFDAVVGNPPYTRWTEIPDETQKLIRTRLGKLMKKYGLTPQVSRGVEPGIYTYWIMHATNFLKEGGRLGMIISNTWLQTDYGIGFGNFLLDNFRVKAIIDIGRKLFKGALTTTCIVLAERESDENRRLENEVAFIYIPGEVESGDVAELLEAVETGRSEKYAVVLVKQRDIPRDRKWIDLFFKTVDISTHPLMTKLGELFEPLRGNTTWGEWSISHGKRPDPGSSEFHYLSPSKIKEFGLEKWAYPNAPLEEALIYPAITSARQTNFFTFTEEDWEEMYKSDDQCYMFVCHVPREKLPKEVEDYIRWGETECRARGKGRQMGGRGRLANETEAAKARAKEPKRFYGWYDLGGTIPVPIFATYYGWYKTRFIGCSFPIGMSHNFISLVPKKDVTLNEVQTKALLGFLNSSFTQYFIETKGRKSPGGVIGLEVDVAREMPILDVRKLNDRQLNSLAKLFDELEHEARKIGGASGRQEMEKLKPKIYEIDRAVAAILGIKKEDVEKVGDLVDLMVERRTNVAR
jgi:hypothetical protein